MRGDRLDELETIKEIMRIVKIGIEKKSILGHEIPMLEAGIGKCEKLIEEIKNENVKT